MLVAMGAQGFAERARRQLLATGETVRSRVDETDRVLTPQEEQVARLARDGLSNPEIGARLFISPRTAQYHLKKVFAKTTSSRATSCTSSCRETDPFRRPDLTNRQAGVTTPRR